MPAALKPGCFPGPGPRAGEIRWKRFWMRSPRNCAISTASDTIRNTRCKMENGIASRSPRKIPGITSAPARNISASDLLTVEQAIRQTLKTEPEKIDEQAGNGSDRNCRSQRNGGSNHTFPECRRLWRFLLRFSHNSVY